MSSNSTKTFKDFRDDVREEFKQKNINSWSVPAVWEEAAERYAAYKVDQAMYENSKSVLASEGIDDLSYNAGIAAGLATASKILWPQACEAQKKECEQNAGIKILWAAELMKAFPELTNNVNRIISSDSILNAPTAINPHKK